MLNAANAVSVGRCALALVVVAMGFAGVGLSPWTAVLLVALIFLSDAVDGALARHFKTVSLLGSFLDIFADRTVEFAFFLFFFVSGVLPPWFLVAFYSRIVVTDCCRWSAFRAGKVPPSGIILRGAIGSLTLSPVSRAGYAGVKMILMAYIYVALTSGSGSPEGLVLSALLAITVVWSLARAFPIVQQYGIRWKWLLPSEILFPTGMPWRGQNMLLRLQIAFDISVISVLLLVLWNLRLA